MDSAGNFYQGIYNQSNLTIDAGDLVITGLTDGRAVGQTGGHLVTAGVSTDWLPEGSRLYFTTGRARAAFSSISPVNIVDGVISLGYANSIVLSGSSLDTAQDIREEASPVFAGLTLGTLSGVIKAAAGVLSGSATTDDLTEGKTNLYYTDARARAAITASLPVSVSAGVVSLGYTANLRLTGSQLDTVQDIQTSSSPTFARLSNSSLGTYSVIIGTNAAPSFTGDRSVIIGDGAVAVANSATQTVAIGNSALAACTGSTNTACGAQAGFSVTSGNSNVIIGCDAGRGTFPLTTGTFNVLIGPNANTSSAAAFKEIVIGQGIGAGNNTAKIYASGGLAVSNLTAGVLKANAAGLIASGATTDDLTEGKTNLYFTTARAQAAITASLPVSITAGVVSLGYSANLKITFSQLDTVQDIATSASPVFARILDSSISSFNSLMGTSAGTSLTTGSKNMAVGTQSLAMCTTGENNAAIGFTAGYAVTTGGNNVFIGNSAGRGTYGLTTGDYGVYIGAAAYPSATNAARELVFGATTGNGSDTCTIQATLGLYVSNLTNGILKASSGRITNTAVTTDDLTEGKTNLYFTTARAQAAITASLPVSITAGVVSLGYSANLRLTGSQLDTVQDIQTSSSPQFTRLLNSPLGTSCVLIGTSAGAAITTAARCVAIGESALSSITSGINCVAIGVRALRYATGNNNTAVGYQAGQNITTAAQNTLLGAFAGNFITTGGFNALIGMSAGGNITSGDNNMCMGINSGYSITTSGHNTALGNYAMAGPTPLTATAGYNVAIGSYALYALGSTGNANTAIGYQSLYAATTGAANVSIGQNSSVALTTGGNNVVIGTSSMPANTAGTDNTIIGYNSGRGITNGSFNVHIGAGCQASAVNASSEIIIAGTSGTTVGKGSGTCYISSPYGLYHYSAAYCHLVSTAFNGGTATWAFYNDGTTTYNNGFQLLSGGQLIVQPFAGLYKIDITGNMLNYTNYSQINIFPTNLPGYSPAFNSPATAGFVGCVSASVLSRPYVSGTPTSTGWTIGFPGGSQYNNWPARVVITFISL